MSCHVYIYSNVLIVEIRCVVYKYAYGRAYMAYTDTHTWWPPSKMKVKRQEGEHECGRNFGREVRQQGQKGGTTGAKLLTFLHLTFIHTCDMYVTCM